MVFQSPNNNSFFSPNRSSSSTFGSPTRGTPYRGMKSPPTVPPKPPRDSESSLKGLTCCIWLLGAIFLILALFTFQYSSQSEVKVQKNQKEVISDGDDVQGIDFEELRLVFDQPDGSTFNATEFVEELSEITNFPRDTFRVSKTYQIQNRIELILQIHELTSIRGNSMSPSDIVDQVVDLLEKNPPNILRFHLRRDSWRYLTEEDILGGSAVVDLIPSPTVTLAGGKEICEGDTTDLLITFKGGPGPWSFTVERVFFNTSSMQQETENIRFENVYDNPLRYNVSATGVYSIKDHSAKGICPAYTTPGNAHVKIHPLPEAILRSGVICTNSVGQLAMELTGTAPWNVKLQYGGPHGEILNINSIEETPFTHELNEGGDYRVLSVSDRLCSNPHPRHTAPIFLRSSDPPQCRIQPARCVGDKVIFHCSAGTPPFTFSYSDGVQYKDLVLHSEHGELSFNHTGVYNVLSVRDGNGCRDNNIAGGAFRLETKPSASWLPLDPNSRCVFPTRLGLVLAGAAGDPGPWTLSYRSHNGLIKHETAESSPFFITAEHPGEYTVLETCNQLCCSNHTAAISLPGPPVAEITGGQYVSQEISVSLSGVPPFELEYSENGVEKILRTTAHTEYITPREGATYRFVAVRDASGCGSSLAHLKPIIPGPGPEGTLRCRNGGYFKPGESAYLEIDLTGIPPWTISLSVNDRTVVWEDINTTPARLDNLENGDYKLLSIYDSLSSGAAHGTCRVRLCRAPELTMPSITPLCGGQTNSTTLVFDGSAPWSVDLEWNSEDGYEHERWTAHDIAASEFKVTRKNPGRLVAHAVRDQCYSDWVSMEKETLVQAKPFPSVDFFYEQSVAACTARVHVFTEFSAGSPPFTIQYFSLNNKDKLFTETAVSKEKFRTAITDEGEWRLLQVSDAFCSARPEITLAVPSAAAPHCKIANPRSDTLCLEEEVEIECFGTPPWTIEYVDGFHRVTHTLQTPKTKLKPLDNGRFTLHFVSDGSSCPPAAGVIGTRVVASPTAAMARKGDFCQEDSLVLLVNLTGTPPWSIQIDGPTSIIEYSDIYESPFEATVYRRGEYKLVQVADAKCQQGIATGTVIFETPKALIVDAQTEVCAGQEKASIYLAFQGTPPFTFSYTLGGDVIRTKRNIQSTSFSIFVRESGVFMLTDIIDGTGCHGQIDTSQVSFIVHPMPTAHLRGGGTICTGENSTLIVDLTGTPPWRIVYRSEDEIFPDIHNILTSPHEIYQENAGYYSLIEVEDKYCRYSRHHN